MTHQRKSKSKRKAERTILTLRVLKKVFLRSLYENCQKYPWFHELSQCIRDGEWSKVYDWTVRASTEVYGDAAEHFAAAQIVALVKKYPFDWKFLKLKESPEDAAYHTFLASERRCGKINRLFGRLRRTPYAFRLEYMRRWILHVLGDKPNLLEVYDACDYSSGANLGVHGNATNLFRKMYPESLTVTETALPYVRGMFKRNQQWSLHMHKLVSACGQYVCVNNDDIDLYIQERVRRVTYNGISFVPKTAATHRGIAVEPLLNGLVQTGVDTVLRRKLLKHGYDLQDQSRNQRYAREGSISGMYSTMDLSSASDSISVELARFLLPPEWFDLLNRIRSPSYMYRGKVVRYEKFCSMGNGFCFPLETLIFASAVRAEIAQHQNGDRTHCVYGDDIIVPTDCFDGLRRLLHLIGFKVNPSKSFKNGPFRESCGADWYSGQDVRPVYLDYDLGSDATRRIFHNATYRSERARFFFEGVRPYVRSLTAEGSRFLRPYNPRVVWPKNFKQMTPDEKFIVLASLNGAYDVELDEFMASKWSVWNSDEHRWSWKEFVYTSVQDESTHPGFERARYLALLRGSPEGKLAVRRKTRSSVISK